MSEHQLEQLVRDAIARNAAGTLRVEWTPPAVTEVATLARLIDHTLLKPEAGEEQIRALCADAVDGPEVGRRFRYDPNAPYHRAS